MNFLKQCILLMSALSITSCVHMVSYYDSLSYKNLTDLKGETRVFFESCQTTIAAGDKALEKIDGFVLSSSKAYEYEKGKDLNDDTVSQLEIIGDTIQDVKLRYASNKYKNDSCKAVGKGEVSDESTGCLTIGYCTGKWRVLETAFDIAISTEKLKLEESK